MKQQPPLKIASLFFRLLLILTLSIFLFSCKGGSDDVEPSADFVKFKVDGKEVSQANAKGKWDLECRFMGYETAGYRFQLGLSTVTGDAPSFSIHFNTNEKYVANKDYTSIDPKTPNTYSYADFKVPTDDLIIQSKSFNLSGGVTILLTDITEDRVKGKFTVNANHVFDSKQPSITDGEFSAKRRNL
jgi:hypothetical protein